MDEPFLGKINPSDCTNFDCDGLKKAMIYDNDVMEKQEHLSQTLLLNGTEIQPEELDTTEFLSPLEFPEMIPVSRTVIGEHSNEKISIIGS